MPLSVASPPALPPPLCCLLPQKHEKARREKAGGVAVEEIDENFTRLYWEQMLQVGATATLQSGKDGAL